MAEPTREIILHVLQALMKGDMHRSRLASDLSLERTLVDATIAALQEGGFLFGLPDPTHMADDDDLMSYRISDRGDALVSAGGSLDNPYERALDKIEFMAEDQEPSRAKKAAYQAAWEALAEIEYKDRHVVRSKRASRSKGWNDAC